MQLSKRLERVAANVQSRGVVADIGCDHGFTSIHLIKQEMAEKVIAMDINQGPLERAREHIHQYRLEDKITVRLSDGAAALKAGEADTLLISGMGGSLICKILKDSPEVVRKVKELVLSPQSEIFLVRHLLHEIGFCICSEEMLRDQGKYYVIIRAVPGSQNFSCEDEYIYGRYLIQNNDKILQLYLQKEKKRVEGILASFKNLSAQESKCRLEAEKEQITRTLTRLQEEGGRQV